MGHNLLSFILVLSAILLSFSTVVGQASREIRETLPLNRDGTLLVDTYKGSITIEVWDKAKVDIGVQIESDEEEKVEDTEILFDASPSSVRIKTDYDKVRSGSSGPSEGDGSLPFVHYAIKMPEAAELQINDYKSDSKISDLRSSITLNTYKGTVIINGLHGALDLETYKGDVTVEFAGLSGDSSFETYKGEIDIKLPKDAGVELDAELGRKGNLDSEFDIESALKSGKRGHQSYRETINEGGPALRIETYKGDIRLLRK